jgi:signal transduction histidine kinase/CheY-like chemotaxis protein
MFYVRYLVKDIQNELYESSHELVLATSRKLIVGVSLVLFMTWMFAGMSDISLRIGRYFSILFLLILLDTVVLFLMVHKIFLAQSLWLCGISGIVLFAAYSFPGSVFIYFYLPLPFIATLLISWHAGLLMEGLIISELALLNWLNLYPLLSPQSLGMVIPSGLLGMLGWIAFDEFYSVTRWATFYSRQAKNALNEAREKQVDLLQTQEDLLTANQELSRLTERLKILQQVADEARQAKAEFVSNVSHELRAPLNMVIGFAELIMRSTHSYGRPLPRALLADITTIHRNAQHLARLVDDVLDLSQIEADRMALTREKSSVTQIVEMAADVVRPLYESKKLSLEIEVAPGLPSLFCDQTRIRQILINLLSNAGRFTERGEVKVKVEHSLGEVLFRVSDTGPGIPKEQQARLFEPFQQLDTSIRREHGGSGLGLSISKRFVEMHGGKIWMESEPGSGTIISFTLPLPNPVAIDLPSSSGVRRWINDYTVIDRRTRPFQADLPRALPHYILVDSGSALKRFLNRYMENVVVTSFHELKPAIQELSHSPAQALVVNTPKIVSPNGALELYAQLIELPYETPAVVCWLPGKEDIAHEIGVIDYLLKPIDLDALLASVQNVEKRVKSILVVDDEESALQLIMRALLSAPPGYEVWRASTGEMALDMMRERQPDLVLLDMVMPDKDGSQILSEKKADETIRDIPVIVVSSRDPVHESFTHEMIMVNRKSGLSARELVEFIEAVSEKLTPHLEPRTAGQPAPGSQATPVTPSG